MNKHSALSPVALLVIAGIVILLGILFYSNAYGGVIDFMDREACRLNVQAQAATRGVSTNIWKVASGKSEIALKSCKTYNIHFKEEEVQVSWVDDDKVKQERYPVYIDGQKKKTFKKLTNDIVNQVIAKQLQLCWYQFHEGQMDIFNGDFLQSLGIKGKNSCYVCNRITFDQDVKDNRFEDFFTYINITNVTTIGDTYYNYITMPTLSDKSWAEIITDAGVNEKIPFEKAKTYSIIFRKVGGDDPDYFAYVVPSDKYYSICKGVVR